MIDRSCRILGQCWYILECRFAFTKQCAWGAEWIIYCAGLLTRLWKDWWREVTSGRTGHFAYVEMSSIRSMFYSESPWCGQNSRKHGHARALTIKYWLSHDLATDGREADAKSKTQVQTQHSGYHEIVVGNQLWHTGTIRLNPLCFPTPRGGLCELMLRSDGGVSRAPRISTLIQPPSSGYCSQFEAALLLNCISVTKFGRIWIVSLWISSKTHV